MQELKPLQLQEPEMCPSNSIKTWRFRTDECTEQDSRLRQMWSEPTWSGFQLRSKTYLQNKVKETSAPPLFELLWFEVFRGTSEELHHVCKSKKSFASRVWETYGSDVPPLFVVSLIIPGIPVVAAVQYFARTPNASPSEANALWQRFLESDDNFRQERLKLVPTVHDGPWMIKKSVGTKPLIIGKALKTTFYQTPQYLEVVVDICSDKVAKHVTALCRSHSARLAVDIGYVVEGRDEAELPEALLGCIKYNRLDLSISTAITDS